MLFVVLFHFLLCKVCIIGKCFLFLSFSCFVDLFIKQICILNLGLLAFHLYFFIRIA
jgi:hypothetical protein